MTLRNVLLTWAVLIVSLLPLTTAVWDDEAFVVDWQITQLGPLDTVLLQDSTRVTVLSESGVLGSLIDGEVLWRVKLDGESQLVQLAEDVVTSTNYVDGTSVLTVWDPTTGFVKTELASFDHSVLALEVSSDSKTLAVLLSDGSVITVDATTQTTTTRAQLPHFDTAKLSLLDNGNLIVLYTPPDSSKAHYAFISNTLTTHTLTCTYTDIVDFHGTKIVTTTHAISINAHTGQHTKTRLPHGTVIPLATDSLIALEHNRNIEVYTLTGTHLFTWPNVYKYTLHYTQNTLVMHNEYHCTLIDADDGMEVKSYFLGDDKVPMDEVEKIVVKTDGVGSVTSLYQFKDHTYSLVKDGEWLWTRDYSLTEIVAYTVVHVDEDVSVVEEEIRHEEELGLFEAYLFRWTRHLQDLRVVYGKVMDVIPRLLSGDLSVLQESQKESYFGFVKFLVVATKNGQVVALNVLNGQKVWKYDTHQPDILQLEEIDGKIYVFTASGPQFILDSKTGAELDKQLLLPSTNVITLDKESFLLESDSHDVVLSQQPKESYFVKHTNKTVTGFKVQGKSTVQTWTFETTPEEIIVGYAARAQDEKTSNIGIVLGDRSVLYKYLYPNVAAVGVLNTKTGVLYVNIIDTLTGNILHSQFHDAQVQPDTFHAVVGEHWIVYTYFSTLPSPEQKIVVIDMFESFIPDIRYTTSTPTTAFGTRTPPAVSSLAFILPHRVHAMGLTTTRFGVTTRAILLALDTDQIVYIPKHILSSRRVAGREMTNVEKTEFMRLPYEPVIAIEDRFVLSHERAVMGTKELVSLATNLESTSVVCSFGDLDVFCTRVAPSLEFDRLTAKFDKAKMLGSLFIFVSIVAFLRPIKAEKDLRRSWIRELRK